MFKRISVISSVALAVLLVAGLAYGAVAPASQAGATSPDVVADNSSPSDDPTADDTSRTDSKDDPSNGTKPETTGTPEAASASDATGDAPSGGIFPVDEAGTVEIAIGGTGLELISATPNDGFEVSRTRTEPDSIKVKFRSGSLEVEFEGELEDGVFTVKVTRETADRVSVGTDTVSDDQSDSDPSDDTSEEATPIADMTKTFEAGSAGTVTISITAGVLTLDGTTENDGWSITKTRTQSDEIKVEFSNGSDEVEFEAELDGGQLETKSETKTSEGDGDSPSTNS